MKFVITNARGQRIGQPMSDRKAVRQVARSHVRAGQAVMIFFATDTGEVMRYSSEDTAAAHRVKKTERKSEGYQVGAARFRHAENAEKAALTKLAFAATVNPENMSDDERKDAFNAFFGIKAPR